MSRTAGAGLRTRIAFPLSLTVHAVGVATLLSVPFWTAAELPEPPNLSIPCRFPPSVVHIATQPTPPPRTALDTRRGTSAQSRPAGPSRPIPNQLPDGPPLPDWRTTFDAGLPQVDGPGCPDCSGPPGAEPGIGPGDPGSDPGPRVAIAGQDVQPPRKLRDAAPVYPELALRTHVQGRVVVECTIDTNGRIANARLVSGHPLLDAAALTAVSQWVYTPTLLRGLPVAVIMTVTVHFTLSR